MATGDTEVKEGRGGVEEERGRGSRRKRQTKERGRRESRNKEKSRDEIGRHWKTKRREGEDGEGSGRE